MNSYEEIKNLLEKKDFQSALLVAFSNSFRFKLTSKINNQKESSSIETTIDLLQGITTKVSDSNLLNNPNNLRQFHNNQLEKVQEIWDTNRKILMAILEVLANNENVDVSNFKTSFIPSNLGTSDTQTSPLETAPFSQTTNNNVDDIVDLMLEEEDISEIADENKENEEITITAEQEEMAAESWDEFMDDLSAEEEAVTEKVIVNEAPSDEEIDDWSEWVDIEDESEGEKVDWTQEDWQEEEMINR
jgi:hypothetical protein